MLINVPLGANFTETVHDFILKNFQDKSPNFGRILILTPSSSTAEVIRMSFLKNLIIPPKTSSVTEEADKSRIQPISDFKSKLILYEIVKEYIPNFSTSSILSYVEDFLELDKLIQNNETNLAEAVNEAAGKIENMASNLQSSIVNFLRIYLKWQEKKRQFEIYTQNDINFIAIENLSNQSFEEYEAVFLLYFQGINLAQIRLMQKINSLNHGFVFILGANEGESLSGFMQTTKLCNGFSETFEDEQKLGFAGSLLNLATKKIDSVALKIGSIDKTIGLKLNQKFYYSTFDNSIELANQLFLRAINVLNCNSEAKIGFICHKKSTGCLITEKFRQHGIETTTVFSGSVAENALFRLFILYAGRGDLLADLEFIKSNFTVFETNIYESFENSLREPNLLAKNPLYRKISSNQCLRDFILDSWNNFKLILKSTVILEEMFEEVEKCISEIVDEVENFRINDANYEKIYLQIIEDFALKKINAIKNSNQIFILSEVEARGLAFDWLFMADLSENITPSPASKNKILNHHLQKMLNIEGEKRELEWLNFAYSLTSSANMHLSFSLTSFEEKEVALPSPFLLHAMESFAFTNDDENFAIELPVKIEEMMPVFNSNCVKKLTPTSFENLITNPFTFYAKNILKIDFLTEISDEFPRNHLGILLHEAIYNFHKNETNIASYCLENLKKRGYFKDALLYEKYFTEISQFFEEERLQNLSNKPQKVLLEEFISTWYNGILFEAKPDRVEFFNDRIVIIDYKVYSSAISVNEVERGIRPQLPFQGYIISKNYPKFKGKIQLKYRFLSLSDILKPVQDLEIPMENFEIVEHSVDKLFCGLKNLFYKEGSSSVFSYFARNL